MADIAEKDQQQQEGQRTFWTFTARIGCSTLSFALSY